MDAKELLRQVWVTAFKQDKSVSITCRNASEAQRLRHTLYNTGAAARRSKTKVDHELLNAVEACSLQLQAIGGEDAEGEKVVVVCTPKAQLSMMTNLAEQLAAQGVTVQEDAPDRDADGSKQSVMERLALEGVLPSQIPVADIKDPAVRVSKSNPYFTREG